MLFICSVVGGLGIFIVFIRLPMPDLIFLASATPPIAPTAPPIPAPIPPPSLLPIPAHPLLRVAGHRRLSFKKDPKQHEPWKP